MSGEQQSCERIVVIGGGLAGLSAAVAAGQAGGRVTLLDSHAPGGRARTEIRDGFRFNQGPHAVYRGGPGRRVLARLGIRPAGHAPPLRGARALANGHLHSLASGRLLSMRAKGQVARVFGMLPVTSPDRWAGRSASEWIEALRLRPDAAAVMAAYVRAATYVPTLGELPADLAIAQVRISFRGVIYLDGGWEQLVSGLLSRAEAVGVEIHPRTIAEAVAGGPGAWQVRTSGGVLQAGAVVVAPGRPTAARRLLPADPGWAELGPEVTAACLDLGLRRPGTRLVFGIDEPLYLSPHSPPGDLAPAGCGLVHAMRYGSTTPDEDRARLWALAASAGISEEDVAVHRFLPRMVVLSSLPPPERGVAGRPPVAVAASPGIFVAGDWVGPAGWLSDGSLVSGEQAGVLAARAVRP